MNVRLHIDRVIVEGLDVEHASRGALQAAIERELARLIAAGGLAPALHRGLAVPSLDAPTVRAGRSAQALGIEVASAVYHGLGAVPASTIARPGKEPR